MLYTKFQDKSNNKRKLAISSFCACCAFLLAFLLFQVLYQADNKYTAGAPYGKAGTLSFSEQHLDADRLLFLIDGWELYSDVLYTPGQIAAGNTAVPEHVFIGQYPNFSYLSSRHSPFGKATYRLRLDYDGSNQILALYLPEIFTDFRLWIDGQEVMPTGQAVMFQAQSDTELVIAVENQSHYYSGITYPPVLGMPQAVQDMLFLRNLFYSLMCFIPFALFLYAVSAWLTGEQKHREKQRFIHFGLLCLFFSIHCAHPFICQSGLNGTLWYAVEDVSFMAVLYEVIALCTIETGLDHKKWYQHFLRPAVIIACVLCGLLVCLILPKSGTMVNLYGAFTDGYRLFCWFYLLACAVWGITTQHGSAAAILTGGGVLGAALVVNTLDNNHFEPIFTGWQIEYAGFFLVILFWILNVFHVKKLLLQNLLLTEHLTDEVACRTSELHAVLDERKAFFSDLAHNLKAPMAAIHGFTNLIQRGNLYLDNDLQGYLDQIHGANEELLRRMQVLGDLNAFDKIDEPRVLLDVDELLTQVYTDNAPEASISGLLFQVNKLGCPTLVYAQRQKLLLLFENLIYNAFSFTPEDGRLTLTPSLANGFVLIAVADTGTGIEPEHLPHLFDRFYIGRENKNEGSGLGLYIAQITAQELGGHIDVVSTVGKGTIFTVHLPTNNIHS